MLSGFSIIVNQFIVVHLLAGANVNDRPGIIIELVEIIVELPHSITD